MLPCHPAWPGETRSQLSSPGSNATAAPARTAARPGQTHGRLGAPGTAQGVMPPPPQPGLLPSPAMHLGCPGNGPGTAQEAMWPAWRSGDSPGSNATAAAAAAPAGTAAHPGPRRCAVSSAAQGRPRKQCPPAAAPAGTAARPGLERRIVSSAAWGWPRERCPHRPSCDCRPARADTWLAWRPGDGPGSDNTATPVGTEAWGDSRRKKGKEGGGGSGAAGDGSKSRMRLQSRGLPTRGLGNTIAQAIIRAIGLV